MRLEREVHWPCGFRRRDIIRARRWPEQLPISTDCPLHGKLCPTPVAPPLRKRLRHLQQRMYDLQPDALLDELLEILDEALGPWQTSDAGQKD